MKHNQRFQAATYCLNMTKDTITQACVMNIIF